MGRAGPTVPTVTLRSMVRWWHARASAPLMLGAVLIPAVMGPLFVTPQMTAAHVIVMGPTAILSGMLGAFAIVAVLKEPVTVLPWTGLRDIARWRLIRVGALLGLMIGLVALTSTDGLSAFVVSLLSLTGEALLGAALLWEDIAWTVPLMHAGLSLTFGTNVFGDPHTWAWILHPEPKPAHVIVAVALLVVGATAWAYRRPRA